MSTPPKTDVRIFDTHEALSHGAAGMFVSRSQTALAARGTFIVALSGGYTPRRLYALLASAPYRDQVSWAGVHVFWVDERCVPWDHRDSNFKLVYGTLLTKVGIPSSNIHRICGEEEPECCAEAYDRELRSFFGTAAVPRFDLIILGVGTDGHTASLFPGTASLREAARFAVPVHLDAPKLCRVTMTLPVLNNAEEVLMLASGPDKASVVHEILEDGNPRRCPAGLVRPASGRLIWMLGRDAAGLIGNEHASGGKAD